MIEIIETIQIPISKLSANNGQIDGIPKNPRFIKNERYQKLLKSIQDNPEFLGARELIVKEYNGKYVVLCGNMRYRAAKESGFDTIPCKVIPKVYTTEQIKAIIIKDNISFGDDDLEALANEWDLKDLEEWGYELPSFDEDNIEELEAKEDDYEMSEQMQVDVILGDLIEIGEHRLLCGDSTDSDQVAKLMNGEKAELLLTDPPYGIGIDGQKESKATNPKHNRKYHEFRGWDTARPEKSTFNLILSFADKAIIWGGNYFADLLPATRGWIYWNKGQDGLTMSDGELAWTTENKPLRAVTVNRGKLKGSVHPTQKPIEVITFCLEWAEMPKLVLDTYLGSGSTMVAAHQLKRKCYGMELDPKYCQVIIDRMRKLDPTLVIKINGKLYNKQSK